MKRRIVPGRLVAVCLAAAVLAAVGAWYMSFAHDNDVSSSITATFMMYDLYAVGFILWVPIALRIPRAYSVGAALTLLIMGTGLYGSVVGVYLFFVLGLPAVGALIASMVVLRHAPLFHSAART